MVIPAAMHIEAAAGEVKDMPAAIKVSLLEELRMFGSARAQEIGAAGMNPSFMAGYLLGLETARVWLAGNPAYVAAEVDF